MDWYVVDKDYIRYLIQFDSRVGYVEYGEKLKLHVGVLLTVNGCHYYVPISARCCNFKLLEEKSSTYSK